MLEGLHELEKEADRMLQHSLAALFNDTSLDVLKVIQWKEIYECVEDATDRCQDAADLLERAGVKYA
jgi:uncharacterized protein Yka (UPF0111/DUF47 family)